MSVYPENAKVLYNTQPKILTDTRQTLLSKPHQHVETKVAVCWFVEVFEPPYMVTILFQILHKINN